MSELAEELAEIRKSMEYMDSDLKQVEASKIRFVQETGAKYSTFLTFKESVVDAVKDGATTFKSKLKKINKVNKLLNDKLESTKESAEKSETSLTICSDKVIYLC
jgi:hypothetical protein